MFFGYRGESLSLAPAFLTLKMTTMTTTVKIGASHKSFTVLCSKKAQDYTKRKDNFAKGSPFGHYSQIKKVDVKS